MTTAIRALSLAWVSIMGVCSVHAAEEYVRDLQSGVPSVRAQAAISLGRIGDRAAVPALIEALKDPEKAVRREAAKALGAIKDARAVGALVAALRDGDVNVRAYAAYALGEIKASTAAGALLEALRDPEWCVRDQAAWALRETHDPEIAGPLAAALKEEDADLAHVVWVLRHVEGTHATDHLAALLKDADAEARLRAVHALGELRNAGAVDPLIAALTDSDPGVRRSAVEALLRIGDDRAKAPLRELVAREDDPAVREAAEKALFEMSREKDLAAHWSFDDQNREVAKDLTGRGNDGVIRGCTPAEGKVGPALRFAQGQYIELGTPPDVRIGGRPLTIMAWAKSDAENGVVIARGGAWCGFSLYIMGGTPKFGIHRLQDGPTYIAAGDEEVVGSWVHLAGVVKSDCVELYVNGRLAATTKTDGYIPGECGQGMEIGFDVANSPAEITDNFEGLIDEVKVYHAALSAEEIAEQCGSEQ